MSSRRRTPSPPDLKTQDVVIFLSHAWCLSRVYLWTSSGHGFPVDGQVCCRTLRALGCTLEHQKYVVAGASRTQAHPFLIDLVRWLRKTVRSPPGLVRLPSRLVRSPPGLVRLPSGLVRFFLVALAAEARADGSASGTKRCILAKKPTRSSQAEESTAKSLQASLAPALPSFVPSCSRS